MIPPLGRGGRQDFHDLMRHRIMDILLVSSPYDTFLLEEAGQLSERLLGEFRNFDLHYGPGLTGVSQGAEALALAREAGRFNLIITGLRLGDMTGADLARQVRSEGLGIPVILLAYDHQELVEFMSRNDLSDLDRTFLWQGDARIVLAIIKYVEDKLNVAHDVRVGGVQVILLIEDNVRFYSSFLPVLYMELFNQSQRLISEGANVSRKITRMRARPKILLCSTYEEAQEALEAYQDEILGIISDIEFPRGGRKVPDAGLQFARHVRSLVTDVPVILQSSRPELGPRARDVGADFLLKGSPLLLFELRRVMKEYFGFGDFVFRLPDGTETARARDLRTLEEKLRVVPGESVAYHAERNHFSKWLKARTEFSLAHDLRPRKVTDFETVEDLRSSLIRSISAYRRGRSQAVVADFDRDTFEGMDFHRIGGGSLGGKARGLAFVRQLLGETHTLDRFEGVSVTVPPAVVLATDVFDSFLDEAGLRQFAIHCDDDAEIERRFLEAPCPDELRRDLQALLARVRHPLAVRSSSILEDSRYQPFTGVYETYMLPNNERDAERLDRLLRAIKRVYASTFSSRAKSYLRATPYRLEEEKMAVILQRVVGGLHGDAFYPDFAGVARSHNFYPSPPLRAEDGVAAVALGLGRTVVEGGNCLRFCPRHPQSLVQFSSVTDALDNTQRQFWALDMRAGTSEMREILLDLEAAETHGTLTALASTYSRENNAISDGLGRPGVRVVTFAAILKQGIFPLAEILEHLLEIGSWGMGAPVEIELAVSLGTARGEGREFGVLQMRPLALSRESEALDVGEVDAGRLICRSASVLGNGRIEGIRDIVVVDVNRFDRSLSRQAAQEIGRFNGELIAQGVSYLLVGVGRWGSRDPWMGIPVAWDQISGARAIVEAGFRDFRVIPSQGTHFFQNLTSFNVGYFTVNPDAGEGFVDWDWLAAQPAVHETAFVRHLHFDRPIVILMNGKKNEGMIFKPEPATSS